MSHRKAVEAEMKRYDSLSTRLENNLKNITQTLVAERNTLKTRIEAKDKKMGELDRQNVQLKAYNDCMDQTQKLFEKHAFMAHNQNIIEKTLFEAATRYAGGDRASEAGSFTNPPSENQTPRQRDSSFHAPAADDATINLDDDEERHANHSNSRE